MSNQSCAALFPLPLSVFEHYMLTDDRPAYPMTSWIQLDFTGEINRTAFESALAEALSRHPMFCALVDCAAQPRPCWILANGLRPPVDYNTETEPIVCPQGERIDLSREVGLRIWVRRGNGKTNLTFQVHHSCSDAVGVMQFIGDLLAAYGVRTTPNGQKPALQPLQAGRLSKRGNFTVALPAPVSRTRATWDTVRETAKWLGRRPAPLSPPDRPTRAKPARAYYPGISTHSFSEGETRDLRAVTRQRGVTLNDLLLRDLFHAIDRWNRRHRQGRSGRWLRINMPMSLRERQHDHMPAANVMSHAFLTHRARECDDPSGLLESIHWETEQIKRWRLGLYFLGGLAFLERIRGALPLAVSGGLCFATAVMTNIGDPTRRFTARFPRQSGKVIAGDLILEGMTGVPPIRPKTRAAFAAGTYARRLTVAVRCDPHLFSPDESRDVLTAYVERLQRTMCEAKQPG